MDDLVDSQIKVFSSRRVSAVSVESYLSNLRIGNLYDSDYFKKG